MAWAPGCRFELAEADPAAAVESGVAPRRAPPRRHLRSRVPLAARPPRPSCAQAGRRKQARGLAGAGGLCTWPPEHRIAHLAPRLLVVHGPQSLLRRGHPAARERLWPGDAAGTVAWIRDLHLQWQSHIEALTDEQLCASGFTRRPFPNRPFSAVVARANVELGKNAAEIGHARFLYAVRTRSVAGNRGLMEADPASGG